MSQYEDYGFPEDYIPHHHQFILEPFLKLLDKSSNKYILDLGCGTGYYASQLIDRGFNCYGTDASEGGITIAKKKYSDRFFLQNLDNDDLPEKLQDIPFNTIVSTEVIEHLYNPQEFLDFCAKILKKNGGGELILSTPYNGYLKNIVISLFDKWDHHLNPLWLGGHIKFWSKKTLTKALENSGFEVVRFVGCGRVPWIWKSMLIKARIS